METLEGLGSVFRTLPCATVQCGCGISGGVLHVDVGSSGSCGDDVRRIFLFPEDHGVRRHAIPTGDFLYG